jgi:hypothetical protein
VTGTTIDDNVLSGARIGLLIRNAPGVRVIDNRITDVSVFGISVRGLSQGVVGSDNIISGRGFQPIDTRGGADAPTLTGTNLNGWQHRTSLNFLASWRYHPLLTAWIVIVVLVAVFTIIVRLRRRPARPYAYAVPWRTASPYSELVAAETVAAPVLAAVPTRPAAAVAEVLTSAPAASRPVEPVVTPPVVIPPAAQPAAIPVAVRPVAIPAAAQAVAVPAAAQAVAVPAAPQVWQPYAIAAEAIKAEPQVAADGLATRSTRSRRTRRTRKEESVPEVVASVTVAAAEPVVGRAEPAIAPAEPAIAAIESAEAPEKKAPEPPPSQFWKWLADGSWTSEQPRVPSRLDQEAPA